jgi:hypothetical protein
MMQPISAMKDDRTRLPQTGRQLVGNAALWEALRADLPNFNFIKDLVTQAYVAETGNENGDTEAIAWWLRHAVLENPRFDGLCVERTVLRYVMHPDLAGKFWHLMQRKCQQCSKYQKFKTIIFTLHTPPMSRQVPNHAAFKSAIRDYLGRVQHDFTDFFDARLCVTVTFILAGRSKKPDVDNLAKNLLDALEDYAYRNDEQIDHLDLLRVSSGGNDSFMTVQMAGTDIGSHLDVIRPEFDVRWVSFGVGPIDLTPYVS